MPTKIKPFTVTFKSDEDADEALRHITTISNLGTPADMTQMHDNTWSIVTPGMRLMTVGKDIFIRLYHGTMRVFSKQVEDVEDSEGRSIKKLLN